MNQELFGDRKEAWVINDKGEINHVETIATNKEWLTYFLRSFARSIQEPRRATWGDVFRDEISAMEAKCDRLQSQIDFWRDQITVAKRKGNAPIRKALLYG